MDITEKTISVPMLMIMLVIGFVIVFILLDKITDGKVVRWIVCGILFWVPMGASFSAISQGCAAIPA